MSRIFRNIDAPITQLPLYQLSIRSPGNAYSDLQTYTFPMSPSSIRMEPNSLSSYTDTQGTALHNGVTRVVDTYGLSPPSYTIEGTTGWDLHSTDGYTGNGLQSIQMLQTFLNQYVQLNQNQRQAGDPNLYALEFSDFFSSQFWQIEPIGPQIIRQSNDRPMLSYYRFRWAAICPVRQPPFSQFDVLLGLLSTPAQEAIINATIGINLVLGNYDPVGIATIAQAKL
jgi:hypothetical protein